MEERRAEERRIISDRRMPVIVAGSRYCEKLKILKVRLIMITKQTYVGEFYLPEVKRRLSDAMNDEKSFINLTNVIIDPNPEPIPYMALNKELIVSVEELTLSEAQDLKSEEPKAKSAA